MLHPDLRNLLIGRLRLETPAKLESFKKFTNDLDIRGFLQAPAMKGARHQISTRTTKTDETDVSASSSKTAPLVINVRGLHIGTTLDFPRSGVCILFASIVDPTNRLERFIESLRRKMFAAGFLVRPFEHSKSVMIVNSLRMLGDQKVPGRERIGQKTIPAPSFDATGLIKSYENFCWGNDIMLEKLSVTEIGRTRRLPGGGRIEKKIPEVCSFPLPQPK